MHNLDSRMTLLAERFNIDISGSEFDGINGNLVYDQNGNPSESLKEILLSEARAGKVDAGDSRVKLWRDMKEMEEDTVLIYDDSQIKNAGKGNFASSIRTILAAADYHVDTPFVVSLDGIIDPDESLRWDISEKIYKYIDEYKPLYEAYKEKSERLGTEGFGRLTVYGIIGQAVSVFGGKMLDQFNLFGNRIAEGFVREIGGNGENIPYAWVFFRDRKKSELEKELLALDGDEHEEHIESDAEIFVKAKLVGALLPIGFDIITGMMGIDINSKGLGVIPAFFYPVSDTLAAQAALWYNNVHKLRKKGETLTHALVQGTKDYLAKPSSIIGLASISLAYSAGYLGREYLWENNSLVNSGIEASLANLCVFTPLGTMLADYAFKKDMRKLTDKYIRAQ